MITESSRRCTRTHSVLAAALVAVATACAPATTTAPVTSAPAPAPIPDITPTTPAGSDPRVGLRAGFDNAGSAISNMELIASRSKPPAFVSPVSRGDIMYANSDMAFHGNLMFLGNFHGFQIWDIANPASPTLRTAVVCPGGQGDVSVYGNLLFMSVEMPNGRTDCGTGGDMGPAASRQRFRGVRIFDISDIAAPRQVAGVQTCRGSHTHSLLADPDDPANIYVYVSGTGPVRPAAELAGCSGGPPDEDPNTALFRIEVIRVPLAAPAQAQIVSMPRIFANAQTGALGGLWRGGSHGPGTQSTSETDQCHDITTFPELGLAGGACSGNGILLNIRDPANPVRIEEVIDPNFNYWHSATFNNDGSKVIFTDEWGGGTQARCRASDRPEWGANAIFELANGELTQRSYYKLPAPQTATENCVAHNGSLVPVPGRDIMVQAWYQGGISVFDFTDAANPVEIAYFDRGPYSATELQLGGHWSAYWYNGAIYGSEIGRGLDVLRLQPSEHLSQHELDAARMVQLDQLNPQMQQRFTWPANLTVARAYVDQLRRESSFLAGEMTRVDNELNRIEQLTDAGERRAALARLSAAVTQGGSQLPAGSAAARRARLLAETLSAIQ